MAADRFDDWVRSLTAAASRRAIGPLPADLTTHGNTARTKPQEQHMTTLPTIPRTRRQIGLLGGGIIASLLGLGLDADAAAKRKRKRRRRGRRNRNRCLGEGKARVTSLENGGCCAGTACDCGMPLCLVGIPGTWLPVLDPD